METDKRLMEASWRKRLTEGETGDPLVSNLKMPFQNLLPGRFSEEKNHNATNNVFSRSLQYLTHCWSAVESDWKKSQKGQLPVAGTRLVGGSSVPTPPCWLWRTEACRELTPRPCWLAVEEGTVGILQWCLLALSWPGERLTSFIRSFLQGRREVTPRGRRQAVRLLPSALLGSGTGGQREGWAGGLRHAARAQEVERAGCPGIQSDFGDFSQDLCEVSLGGPSASVLKRAPGPLPTSSARHFQDECIPLIISHPSHVWLHTWHSLVFYIF